jgi:hypothetical protein
VAEGRIQLTSWKTARRVIFDRKLLSVIRAPKNGEFWERQKHESAVQVTNLPTSCKFLQMQELYRQRADTESLFGEPKNQWDFSSIAAKSRATTEIDVRLLLLVHNLWLLFVRFIVPQNHT